MKQERHQAIIRIITENEIETQEDLLSKLKEEGYHVTQATVSRDMRELKLLKAASSTGYKYVAPPQKNEEKRTPHFSHALAESVISVDYAQNLIVVKTEMKNRIMKAIMDKAGLDSKAHSIVFSLPVTSTAGMRLMEETTDESDT